MGEKLAVKCKKCKGKGCIECDGSGVILHTKIEEQFDEASEAEGLRLYPGDIGYIEFEEEDYEI